ncbi:hypothetical protein [Haploplasma axanthum]|uniref:Uncharacterized protein n=1 Tax=Haploplasma axanthum TaxID=29552 RepID=A0A449BDN6_HAPAX|nr:hypothetical protein [Haploplasma axanthum]VEU80556.1 Uncharacterised protein [Haploplasma axanthum]
MKKYIIITIWILAIILTFLTNNKPLDKNLFEEIKVNTNYDTAIKEIGITDSIPYALKETIIESNLTYLGKFQDGFEIEPYSHYSNTYKYNFDQMKSKVSGFIFKKNTFLTIFVVYEKDVRMNESIDLHFYKNSMNASFYQKQTFLEYDDKTFAYNNHSNDLVVPNINLKNLKRAKQTGFFHFTIDITDITNYVIDIHIREEKKIPSIPKLGFNIFSNKYTKTYYSKTLSFFNIKENI